MTWKRWFRRRSKPDQFMKLICEQAHHTQRGMDVLLEYIREPSEAKAVTIHAIEKDADEVRRILCPDKLSTAEWFEVVEAAPSAAAHCLNEGEKCPVLRRTAFGEAWPVMKVLDAEDEWSQVDR